MVTNQATQETTLGGYVLTDNKVHFFIFNNGLVLRGIGINEKYLGGVSVEGIQNINLVTDVVYDDGT